jgi:hypothetical protein
VDAADVGEKNREFVPPQAGHRVARAQEHAQSLPELDEQLVTRRMSKAVVDALEAIEVQKEHGERPLGIPPLLFQREAEAIEKERAVWQAGQRIVKDFVQKPGLRQLSIADVR